MSGSRGRFGALFRPATGILLVALAALLAWPPTGTLRARTWEDLLSPLGPGRPVQGFEITALRRGEEHDVVLTLRRASPEGAVEVHILDRGRWKGIRETDSFGVAYESPQSTSSIPECEAVTEAIAGAVRDNDRGGLGPVDAIPLRAEPEPPRLALSLDRLTGARGIAVGLCLAAATWLFASGPTGAVTAAAFLFALGLFLRGMHLDVPFVRDQDVQRVFTGHLPFRELLLGVGLTDRHPPLYFLVLKLAQIFGQREAVVRAPAALFGALWGPGLVVAARALGRRVDVGAMAGLAAVLSVELIARSREVSSIPMFGVLALIAAVAILKCSEGPTRGWRAVLVASVALCFWTYYLAVFLVIGLALPLLIRRRLSPSTGRALGLGAALGAPALILGVVTFFRDRGARIAADEHPTLAWGAHGGREIAEQCMTVVIRAFGPVIVGLFVLAVIWTFVRRREEAMVPVTGLVASLLGIAALAPFARVQAYYIVAVLPLLLLTLIVVASDIVSAGRAKWAGAAALAGAVVTTAPTLSLGRGQYLPDSDAFMPEIAAAAMQRPEARVLTLAHYDTTLLAYYLARRAGVPMDWSRMQVDPDGAVRLEGLPTVLMPLLRVHSPGENPDESAERALRQAMSREPVLVVSREAFHLEGVSRILHDCDVLLESGTGKLRRCPSERPR
ncbi:MAG: glycosyltransferase family 39 protein [Polyangiaceae bacterium]